MNNFEGTIVELNKLFKSKDQAKDIKLLNVGSDNDDEYHWRYRAPSGEIIMISMMREGERYG